MYSLYCPPPTFLDSLYWWIGAAVFWGAAMFAGSFIVGGVVWWFAFDVMERRRWFRRYSEARGIK